MSDTHVHSATGSFQIAMTPGDGDDTPGVGRWTFDKTFTGALDGSSRGQMLGSGDPSTGSAGYVVIEMVSAELDGRSGGFALQHFGIMDSGGLRQQIEVVPGTGLGELAEISGVFTIAVDDDGAHAYELSYSLPN